MALAHLGSLAVVIVDRAYRDDEVAGLDGIFVGELAVVGVICAEEFECLARAFRIAGYRPCAGTIGHVDRTTDDIAFHIDIFGAARAVGDCFGFGLRGVVGTIGCAVAFGDVLAVAGLYAFDLEL